MRALIAAALLGGCVSLEQKVEIACTDPSGETRQATMVEATFTARSFDTHEEAICSVRVAPKETR